MGTRRRSPVSIRRTRAPAAATSPSALLTRFAAPMITLADTSSSVGDAARRGANKVVDAVDNVKDRVDGNPASKPGPDPTDRRL